MAAEDEAYGGVRLLQEDIRETLLKIDAMKKFGDAMLAGVEDEKNRVGALREKLERFLQLQGSISSSDVGFKQLKQYVENLRDQMSLIRDRTNTVMGKIVEWNKEEDMGMIKGEKLEGDEAVEELSELIKETFLNANFGQEQYPHWKIEFCKLVKECFPLEFAETERERAIESEEAKEQQREGNFDVEEAKMKDQQQLPAEERNL